MRLTVDRNELIDERLTPYRQIGESLMWAAGSAPVGRAVARLTGPARPPAPAAYFHRPPLASWSRRLPPFPSFNGQGRRRAPPRIFPFVTRPLAPSLAHFLIGFLEPSDRLSGGYRTTVFVFKVDKFLKRFSEEFAVRVLGGM